MFDWINLKYGVADLMYEIQSNTAISNRIID